jgi:hypothetical protein
MQTAESYLFQAEQLRKAAREMEHSDPQGAAGLFDMAAELVEKFAARDAIVAPLCTLSFNRVMSSRRHHHPRIFSVAGWLYRVKVSRSSRPSALSEFAESGRWPNGLAPAGSRSIFRTNPCRQRTLAKTSGAKSLDSAPETHPHRLGTRQLPSTHPSCYG